MTALTTAQRTSFQPGDNTDSTDSTAHTSTCTHHPDALVLIALVHDEDLGLTPHEPHLVVADALDVARGAVVHAHGLLCLVCGDLVLPDQGRSS